MQGDFRLGQWLVQPSRDVIESRDRSVQLEPKAMDLLVYLAKHQGEVLQKERLIQAVWPDAFVTDEVLTNSIWKIRQALDDDPKNPQFIQTIPRRGYQLIAKVEFIEEEAEEAEPRYRIEKKLGQGAMGEVYLAEDTFLRRRVALKFLLEEMEEDDQWHRRLMREARAAAALDHPYISKVYDTGRMDGRTFIAMEYVEGETLKQRLAKGLLPTDEALRIAKEIAEALELAHREGIVHRDIKPSNIILTAQGHLKVTDFGVAKRLKTVEGEEQDWTVTATAQVSTLGTLPYMSPEQVRGQPVDSRSDIFAFGVLLYEMLSGIHPFRRAQSVETAGAILHELPAPVSECRHGLPAGTDPLIEKMLAKDLDQRVQTVAEVCSELTRFREVKKEQALSGRWLLGAAGLAVLIIAAALVPGLLTTPDVPRITGSPKRLTRSTQGLEFAPSSSPIPMVSDGLRIFLTEFDGVGGMFDTWQIPVGGGEAVRLQLPFSPCQVLALSPDNSQLLVGAPSDELAEESFYLVPVAGGTARRFGDFLGHAAAWSTDGQSFAYTKGKDLFFADPNGSNPRKIATVPGRARAYWPRFSPNGNHIRFTSLEGAAAELWEVSADGSDLHELALTGEFSYVCCGDWTSDGRYFVFEGRNELGVPSLWVRQETGGVFSSEPGEPVQLTFGPTWFLRPTISRDDRQIFAAAWTQRSELIRYEPDADEWVSFLGNISGDLLFSLDFSKDGEWIAYTSAPDGAVWRSRSDGSEKLRLSELRKTTSNPRWSPDGTTVAYEQQDEDGAWRIHLVSAEGGQSRALVPEEGRQCSPTWSLDGTAIAYGDCSQQRGRPIRVVDLETKEVSRLPESDGLIPVAWSPDGRHLLSVSDLIWIPEPVSILLYDLAGEAWRELSKGAFWNPSWSSDGRSIYVREFNEKVVLRIDIRSGSSETVADLAKLPRGFTVSFWIGLTPDDSPITLRDLSIIEVYALEFETT